MAISDNAALLSALRFSAGKHRYQRRKDNASPYINHPIEVAETLLRVGRVEDTDILVAAILHDTIEDTATRPEEIESLFGATVLGLVLEVTDDKSLPSKVRKQLQVEHAPHLSAGAKQIKLADKISNLNDLLHIPPTGWSHQRKVEYVDWSERVVAGLRGVNPELEHLYDETLAEARRVLTAV